MTFKEGKYTLIVWGAVESWGARRRIDFSLTWPVKLSSVNKGARCVRNEYDHLLVCIAFENLAVRNRYDYLNLVCVESLIPWFDDAASHSLDTFIQAPNTLEVDLGIKRVTRY
jgi:hypothetical protein